MTSDNPSQYQGFQYFKGNPVKKQRTEESLLKQRQSSQGKGGSPEVKSQSQFEDYTVKTSQSPRVVNRSPLAVAMGKIGL